jgi:uncharacterized membrane protein
MMENKHENILLFPFHTEKLFYSIRYKKNITQIWHMLIIKNHIKSQVSPSISAKKINNWSFVIVSKARFLLLKYTNNERAETIYRKLVVPAEATARFSRKNILKTFDPTIKKNDITC